MFVFVFFQLCFPDPNLGFLSPVSEMKFVVELEASILFSAETEISIFPGNTWSDFVPLRYLSSRPLDSFRDFGGEFESCISKSVLTTI